MDIQASGLLGWALIIHSIIAVGLLFLGVRQKYLLVSRLQVHVVGVLLASCIFASLLFDLRLLGLHEQQALRVLSVDWIYLDQLGPRMELALQTDRQATILLGVFDWMVLCLFFVNVQPSSFRFSGLLMIALSGVGFCCVAHSHWGYFVAAVMANLAAFLGFVSFAQPKVSPIEARENSWASLSVTGFDQTTLGLNELSELGKKFLAQRGAALLFLLLGCIFQMPEGSPGFVSGKEGWFGIGTSPAQLCLWLGCILQITGFPFIGLELGVSSLSLLHQVFFRHVVGAWCALAGILHFGGGKGSIVLAGSLMLQSFLLIISGLAAGLWRQSWPNLLCAVTSAGQLYGMGLIFFERLASGVMFFMSVSFGGLFLAFLFNSLKPSVKIPSQLKPNDRVGFNFLGFYPLFIVLGMPFTVAHFAPQQLIASLVQNADWQSLFALLVFFGLSFSWISLAYPLGFSIAQRGIHLAAPGIIFLGVGLLSCMSFLWTGSGLRLDFSPVPTSLQGGFFSLLSWMLFESVQFNFDAHQNTQLKGQSLAGGPIPEIGASLILLSIQLLVFGLGYWAFKRSQKPHSQGFFFRVITFCEQGFGISLLYQKLGWIIDQIAHVFLQFESFIWRKLLPKSLQVVSQWACFLVERLNVFLWKFFFVCVGRTPIVSSHVCRQFLTGDVQMYLAFGCFLLLVAGVWILF